MNLPRRNLLILLAVVLLAAAGTYIYFTSAPQLTGAVIDPPKPMPDFTLQAKDGPVSLNAYRGKLVVLFFGYKNCGDVCPLTMANLRQAVDFLKPEQAAQVQVFFISVDWKRDTPAILADYARAFNPTFIGLTGTQEQIDQVTRDYGIFYKFDAPDANGFYAVEHTTSISVLDRQGRLTLIWPYGTTPSDLAADLKTLLNK